MRSSFTAGRNVRWYGYFGKQSSSSSEIYIELSYDPAIPLLGIYQKEFKTSSKQVFVH